MVNEKVIDNKESVIKDSGSMREFATGAHRDNAEGKGRCDLIPMEVASVFFREDPVFVKLAKYQNTDDVGCLYDALDLFAEQKSNESSDCYNKERYIQAKACILLEVAKHYENGANKYGENNWQKGMPLKVYYDSALRHYLKYRMGMQDEPHDSAFIWNVFALLWTKGHEKEFTESRNIAICGNNVVK